MMLIASLIDDKEIMYLEVKSQLKGQSKEKEEEELLNILSLSEKFKAQD